MTRVFHIATIANDLQMYRSMRASMELAGFDEQRCRFSLFDNSESNRFEPYSVLRQLTADGDEPFVILCHQDLLFNAENDAELLERLLRELEERDPNWVLAGNAGVDAHWVMHGWLDEPAKPHRAGNLPAKVISLDENFLVLRRGKPIFVSETLSGFHLYGTDLCLNAFLQGNTAYVVRFLVRHLSSGDLTSAAFTQAISEFVAVWRTRLFFGLMMTTCTKLQIATGWWPNRLLSSTKVRNLMIPVGICLIPRPGALWTARRRARRWIVEQAKPAPTRGEE